jgi:hypothetical protein
VDPGRIRIDCVPQAHAGVLTMHCACGWEMVFILPEEQMVLLQTVFTHLVTHHLIALPSITCEWH